MGQENQATIDVQSAGPGLLYTVLRLPCKTSMSDDKPSLRDHLFCSFVLDGTETVQVTPLRRTLASSPECCSCRQLYTPTKCYSS